MKTLAEKWFEYFPLPLYFISVLLHGMGVYILITLKDKRTNQDTIIMNLSVSEIFMSLFDLAQNILSRYVFHTDAPINYLTISQCTIFVIPNFLILIVLSVDRLMEVYLNIKYKLFMKKSITRLLLLICWSVGLACAIVIISLRATVSPTVARVIFMYIFPFIEALVFITATATYSYIYVKVKANRMPPTPLPSIRSRQSCTRTPLIFPPFLILLTFLVFAICPDITNLLLFYIYEGVGTNLHANILLTFYVTGFICDALIYLFLQKHVRAKLARLFARKRTHMTNSMLHLAVVRLGTPNFRRNYNQSQHNSADTSTNSTPIPNKRDAQSTCHLQLTL